MPKSSTPYPSLVDRDLDERWMNLNISLNDSYKTDEMAVFNKQRKIWSYSCWVRKLYLENDPLTFWEELQAKHESY